ncbi:MAG: type II toxin-antitoxin system VapC family toxin [Bosea sp. (in: a-proteobacteria)]
MRVLLDTNVLSELVRPQAEQRLLNWIDSMDEDQTFISVITVAEIRSGIASLPPSRKRDALDAWLRFQLLERYRDRILPITTQIADQWGEFAGRAKRAGKPLGVMDGFIAATAAVKGLVVATRNTRDFSTLDVSCFNPWHGPDPK